MSPRQQPQSAPAAATVMRFAAMAAADPSAKVRLELACALQRLTFQDRLAIAAELTTHAEDATDSYLPLMTWYGLEPAVTADPTAALNLAVASQIPVIRQYVARRLVDGNAPAIPLVVATTARQTSPAVRRDLLLGLLQALEGMGTQQPPAEWAGLYAESSAAADPILRSIAVRLATIFGDRQAIDNLRQTVLNSQQPEERRREALNALLQLDNAASVDMLHQLVKEDSTIRRDAIHALGVKNSPATVDVLLNHYPSLPPAEKQDAVSVLATRETFAHILLNAIDQGRVNRQDVSAYTLQQLRSFRNTDLQQRIRTLWADDTATLQKSEQIAQSVTRMSPDYLSTGSAMSGRLVFERTCAKCHTLFGEGGTIAPDLTGSGRKKPDYVLRNLIDPGAEIDAAYRLTSVLTGDGRLFNGFMIHQDDKWLVLRTQDAKIRLAMNNVEELVKSNVSMMPEGMLNSFTDPQIRDLLVYLASDDQVSLPDSEQ